ncbi:DUF3093 domain-containing protein [Smaragdicoccus niigatensis]|uniref:DUF3093 domain-containing protein n=1 Tax=Smaragdicoccus niigatensis TaxID=359359 RepID=UPI000380862D|nr:DUF3093 domain-containing protein [Smaragdicoccus niigatensis]
MSDVVRYRETQPVPWWWYLIGLGVAAVLAAEFVMGVEVPPWISFGLLLPIPVILLIAMSRSRLEVTGGDEPELVVGRAHLPVHFISKAAVVPQSAKSAAMGRQFDPAAFLVHRPWVKHMVLVVLDDPDDPTPYWLFSAKKPEAVVAALGVTSDRA